jgi:hypothetical protein
VIQGGGGWYREGVGNTVWVSVLQKWFGWEMKGVGDAGMVWELQRGCGLGCVTC